MVGNLVMRQNARYEKKELSWEEITLPTPLLSINESSAPVLLSSRDASDYDSAY